ncbi:MAG: prenyltransferase [Actinomycetota bacterium]|nr:prenyltransferase [Actinomycetota bacterium]
MRQPELPEVPGVIDADAVVATAAAVAAVQERTGAIPWFPGGHVDPWDHVECAMALSVAGRYADAERAYGWMFDTQRPDGSWPMRVRAGRVEDAGADTNFTAYLAVGVYHHWLLTRSERFVLRAWGPVRRALDFVTALQAPRGEMSWARGATGVVDPTALVAGSSSIHQSLRCGLALADLVGSPQPEWEIALGRLRHALRHHPEAFADHGRFSMDWYYPVLGGVVRGARGRARVKDRWDAFVVPGWGARCVSDRPWVTGAETCELVLSLHALQEYDAALDLFASMQHLRDPDGSYWTGHVVTDDVRWPQERSTWTAAAVILAADALSSATPASGVFVADGLPTGLDLGEDDCACRQQAGSGRRLAQD